VELASKQPGKLNFGNPGNGTSQHLNYEMFRQRADIQLASIPYKGQPQVLQNMLRGDVQFSLFSLGIAAPHLTAGKIKALAVVSDTRVPSLPDVPTLAEAGYPSTNLVPWYGYVVPAATPKAVVARINQAINAAVQVPQVQARLRAMGANPQAPRSVEQINAMIRSDYDTFRAAIQAGNITAE
jgi:tripartite-type tricarboxylate transporter receptor subunit TctC